MLAYAFTHMVVGLSHWALFYSSIFKISLYVGHQPLLTIFVVAFQFFDEYNSKLLESSNYITRRQAVKVWIWYKFWLWSNCQNILNEANMQRSVWASEILLLKMHFWVLRNLCLFVYGTFVVHLTSKCEKINKPSQAVNDYLAVTMTPFWKLGSSVFAVLCYNVSIH